MGVGVMQTKNEVLLEQSAYTKALLSRIGMEKANSVATPVDINADLVTTSDEVEDCDKDLYQSAVELKAVLKGINFAPKWGMTSIELRIDSAIVAAWLQSVVSAEKPVHTKGAAEMLIKRRLGNLREMMIEFGLKIQISLVHTDKNKADVLTRVKKRWLCGLEVGGNDIDEHEQVSSSAYPNIIEVHNKHHVGVDRPLYLARKMDPNISREDVKRVVRACERCQSIDPAPLKHETGEVSVKNNWCRLAIDVMHYRGRPYLSMVDCSPGRFAVWRELRRENTECIITELINIFLERGPVDKSLMGNSTVFRSQMLANMLQEWNVERVFRAVYRPAGNGIVERHHRTVKAIAERGRISPIEAVYWYNSTPRSGQDELFVPQRSVYKYEWRYPSVHPTGVEGGQHNDSAIGAGEEVWVKPPNANCTTRWGRGKVTGVNSSNNIEEDGVPRHVLDVRSVVPPLPRDEEARGERGKGCHRSKRSKCSSHRSRVVCGPCSVSGLCLCRKTAGSNPGDEYELFLVSRRELALIGKPSTPRPWTHPRIVAWSSPSPLL
ncbi:Integrase catalytic core [Trinorchestia longiramus]|nr:Integrase catalytic core [Trinorchestia longiramus]